jgi:hypothetical protein
MASTNIQNANILYDFIITEQNHTNVKLSTRLSYIKVICLFNRYLSYKDFTKITKNDILDYLNSLKRFYSFNIGYTFFGYENLKKLILVISYIYKKFDSLIQI